MYVIGLTGGIGSGKSTVAAMLRELGAVVIDADQVARQVVRPGGKALAAIVEHFGEQVLSPDGTLNRPVLGAIIFQDENKRKLLNRITHPVIKEEIATHLEEIQAADPQAVVIIEAPLLIEAGMTEMVDEIWVVTVEPGIQVKRVMERDKLDYEAALRRVESQMTNEERLQYSQVEISAGKSLAEVRQQVEQEWRRLKTILEGSGV
ncbi:MAG: dephospho-CoA kinase [Clostridia bacterium]|nr:dephospho-CoA kinase [Clostridia bacterium]